MNEKITVRFNNGSGDGRTQEAEIQYGASVQQLLDFYGTGGLTSYDVTVNRQRVQDPSNFTLQDGDVVTLKPTRIEGACS